MKHHHKAWLQAHPHRTVEWLRERIREGFDIHHLDGDYTNNDPDNLVLIEHTDHLMLHTGKRRLGRLKKPDLNPRPKEVGRSVVLADGRRIWLAKGEHSGPTVRWLNQGGYVEPWRLLDEPPKDGVPPKPKRVTRAERRQELHELIKEYNALC